MAWEHGLHRALATIGANHHSTGLTAGIESLSTEIPALDIFSLFQHPLKEPSYLQFNRGERELLEEKEGTRNAQRGFTTGKE